MAKESIVLFNPTNGKVDDFDRTPPWALIYISVYIAKYFDIAIIDQRFEPNWESILKKKLSNNPLCFGVTAFTGIQTKYAARICSFVKKLSPETTVVIGGIHATALPEQTLLYKDIDIVVQGDGEETFYELVTALKEKKPLNEIKGIYFKAKGEVIKTHPRPLIEFSKLPDLPYHLIDLQKYIETRLEGGKWLTLFTSRGCPFQCTFCTNANDYNKSRWQSQPAERAINIIEKLVSQYNLSGVVIQDDNFWANMKRVREFVDLLEKKNLKINWIVHGANIRNLKAIDLEFAKRLKRNGLLKILTGIEYATPRMQEYINKNVKIEDIYSVNKTMQLAGIKVVYSFISGFPQETDDDIKANIDMMFKLKKEHNDIDVGTIKPVVLFPGTPLYDWAIKNGYKPPASLEEWGEVCWENYSNLSYPWLSQERKIFLTNLFYATLLLNPNYTYINNAIFRISATLLLPLMKWRCRTLNFRFSPELRLIYFLQHKVFRR